MIQFIVIINKVPLDMFASWFCPLSRYQHLRVSPLLLLSKPDLNQEAYGDMVIPALNLWVQGLSPAATNLGGDLLSIDSLFLTKANTKVIAPRTLSQYATNQVSNTP